MTPGDDIIRLHDDVCGSWVHYSCHQLYWNALDGPETSREGAMTFDYEGHVCKLCASEEKAHYIDEVKDRLIANQVCFTCDYWQQTWHNDVDNRPMHYIVTEDYEHYVIGRDELGRSGRRGSGFGGREFIVIWKDHDRTTTVTRNLWSQGRIPDHLQKMFEPNVYSLTDTDEIKRMQHYVVMLNL